MITTNEVKLLQGLTDEVPRVGVLPGEKTVLLYARWFVLEVPANTVAAVTKGNSVPPDVVAWRNRLPVEEGAYGQAVRFTNTDGIALVRLISDSGVAVIHPAIYGVVSKFSEPEFRVFSREGAPVAIFNEGTLIGATAQVRVT
jgi:hypothetical protein